MYRSGPGGDGGGAYGGVYGGYGDELACAFGGLALGGGDHLAGGPAYGLGYAPAPPSPMSPRAAGQEAFNDASAHADTLFGENDVQWLRSAYGQGFDPERLLAGDSLLPDSARQPMSPGYHSLYKTELCRSFEETSTCRYGGKCQFAHGQDELRPVMRHPRYKTELCRTFATSGTCPYGTRCRFIHYRGAAPVASAPPGAGGAKLTVTVPPGSPRSPRVAAFLPPPARGGSTPPASPGNGAGAGSPPASPRSPAPRALVPEGAPRLGRGAAVHAGAAPETPPCTPPRDGGSGGAAAAPRSEDGCGGINGNGSGSDDSGGGRAKGRSRLPIFETLCTAAAGCGKEAEAGAPAAVPAAPAPAPGVLRSPKKNSPPPKLPPPAPNRAAMQLRRGAVCE